MPSVVQSIDKKFRTARNARKKYERDWKLNLSFYLGKQWVIYLQDSNKVIDWNPPGDRKPRHTTNLIQPTVRAEYAKISSHRPDFTVESSPGKLEAVDKAKACKYYLDYKWETDDYEDIFKHALLWALICGTAYIKNYYDPEAGQTIDINGEKQVTGDPQIDYVSPFELFIDPFARDINEASWVIHTRVRSREYVKMKYGVDVPPDSIDTLQISGLTEGVRNVQREQGTLPAVVIKEYWERPNSINPNGKYIVIAGNKVLLEQDNPYAEICPIPFEVMRHIPVPDRFYGDCVVTQLRPINVAYNKLYSDMLDNSLKLSNPPLIAPVNGLIESPKWEPGEIIYVNPMLQGKVDQVKIEPYPAQVMNSLKRLLETRDDISGLSDVSRGQIPRGVKSAQGLGYLLEQDETRISTTIRQWEDLIGHVMENVLKLARVFYPLPQLIPVLGENNVREAKLFKAEDIPSDIDVRVVPNSTMPKSMVQQKQDLLSMWQAGIITDPRLILRLSDYGNDQEIFTDLELDSQQAKRENDAMSEGRQAKVEEWQNHVIHITEHSRFMKTVDFENLSPERQALFQQHYEQHRQIVQQAQQAQAGGGMPNGQRGPEVQSQRPAPGQGQGQQGIAQ